MKKLISILLVVAIMASTCAVVLAGSITACAAESNCVSADAVKSDSLSDSKVVAIFIWFIDALRHSSEDAGLLSIIVDGLYDYYSQRYDIEGMMDYLQNSGIVEWVTRIVFPREQQA